MFNNPMDERVEVERLIYDMELLLNHYHICTTEQVPWELYHSLSSTLLVLREYNDNLKKDDEEI